MCEALACCHSPSLSNYRCDLHILLNAVSILLFGVISPLPLLEMTDPERPRGNRTESAHLESLRRCSGISCDLEMFWQRRCKLNGAWWWKAVQVSCRGEVVAKNFRELKVTLMGQGRALLECPPRACFMSPHLQTAVVAWKGHSCC